MDPSDDATIAADVERVDLSVGSTIADRYVVKRELGRGGMGAVFEVLDEQLGEPVALKVLRAPDGSTLALQRFKQEVRLARRVTHRNVARTYDLGEYGELHYLTMELVEGTSLADLLRAEGTLSPARVTELVGQICEGLQAAHAVGIVHRDLKPANILVGAEGRAVITDFGIARSTEEDAGLTVEGAGLMGTPTYMAPEQVRGGPVDARTDLFALGIIVLEMLTGVRAFERDTPLASAVARLEEDPPPLDGVPEGLRQLVAACLQRDPARRPASAADVAGGLASVSESEAPAQPPRTSPPAVAPPSGHTQSFVSTHPAAQGVAVLPFRYRGPPDDAYLAEVLTDEVIDTLSMTRGLKVPAASATAPFAEDRNPTEVGQRLEVDAVVDGTFQRIGERLRLSARLIDAHSGTQVWSDHFDGEMADIFELQVRLAQRVTESLRVQLQAGALRRTVSAEATELYLRARDKMKRYDVGHGGGQEAVTLLERCLERAPDFAPARASLALACARMWFFYRGTDRERNWPQVAREAVAQALERASEFPETHIAAARTALHEGRYRDTATELRIALKQAPTCAAAHALLGTVQCEAGRPDEGVRHIELAIHLDPEEFPANMTAARHHALHGRFEDAQRLLDELEQRAAGMTRLVALIRGRLCLWRRDLEGLRRILAPWSLDLADPAAAGLHTLAMVDDAEAATKLAENFDAAFGAGASPRLTALAHQVSCEVLAARHEPEAALAHLRKADALNLVDIDWIRSCPVLDEVRELPEFPEIERKVRLRAQQLWV